MPLIVHLLTSSYVRSHFFLITITMNHLQSQYGYHIIIKALNDFTKKMWVEII